VITFEHTSGISIKGKNRVRKIANKALEKMPHLCALTAIKYCPEFKQYFAGKKTEGKNGILVVNAIRNKLVLRLNAVVNKQLPYVVTLMQQPKHNKKFICFFIAIKPNPLLIVTQR